MENKQTAVDWLEQELDRQCMIKVFAWEDEAYFRKLLEQAKQMEKEQIIDACHHGVDYDKSPYLNAKEYYNGTYGK
jgi:hypothetical protein